MFSSAVPKILCSERNTLPGHLKNCLLKYDSEYKLLECLQFSKVNAHVQTTWFFFQKCYQSFSSYMSNDGKDRWKMSKIKQQKQVVFLIKHFITSISPLALQNNQANNKTLILSARIRAIHSNNDFSFQQTLVLPDVLWSNSYCPLLNWLQPIAACLFQRGNIKSSIFLIPGIHNRRTLLLV